MTNKTSSIDVEMVTKKHYCHKCGEKLVNNPRTRVIRRGDPDYKKYSRATTTNKVSDTINNIDSNILVLGSSL